jgi:anti-sigma regulatory factor (Ser/Thr protein kinase)
MAARRAVSEMPPVLLRPEAGSAAAARRFVREAMGAATAPDLVDSASLVASELVTNAVLHADTAIRLTVILLDGGGVRVEVKDESPAPAHLRRYSPDSGTGRGLVMVQALSGRWGVEATEDDGKTVWAELGPEGTPDPAAPVDPAGAVPPAIAAAPRPVPVQLLGLSVDIYRQTMEHTDELQREFALILERDPSEGSEPPGRLLGLIGELNGRFGGFGGAARQRMEEAMETEQQSVDLHYEVPADIGPAAARLSDLFEEADSYCRAGDLLTLATPPDALALRRWFLDQFRAQAAGARPESWGGWLERHELDDTKPL